MRFNSFCALLLALTAFGALGCTTIIYQNGAPGDSIALPRRGWLSLHNVRGTRMSSGGLEAVALVVEIDGVRVGECEFEYVENDTCIEDVPLDPGTHQLRLVVQCRNERGSTLGCVYEGEESFNVAAGETISYDFRASQQYPDQQQHYLNRAGGAPADDGTCNGALAALSTAPSCTELDIAQARGLAQQAQDRCTEDELQSNSGLSLLVQAGMHHFFQSPSQCVPASQLGRHGLPSIMVGADNRDFRWPAGTLPDEASTWSWSRQGVSRRILDERRGPRLLSAIIGGLETIAPRVAVFHQVSAAYVDDSKRLALARTASQGPFSLDPRTPHGHLTLLLLAMQVDSPVFADFVGRGVRADTSLHCARPGVAERVARYMTRDHVMSPAEWEGITAMVTRTPPQQSYSGCGYAFRGGRLGGVSHEIRLRWLARFDCSERRGANMRGRAIRPHLRDSMRNRGYDVMLEELRAQYSACLAHR